MSHGMGHGLSDLDFHNFINFVVELDEDLG